jgi:hypothetical protein
MHKRPLHSAITVVGVLIAGCPWAQDPVARDFLHKSPADRVVALQSYPPQEQVDLYLQVASSTMPPDTSLGSVLADNAPAIVPALSDRLSREDQSTRADYERMYLIEVFERIEFAGNYSVSTDQETLRLIEQQVAMIRDPFCKSLSTKHLEHIKQHRRAPGG